MLSAPDAAASMIEDEITRRSRERVGTVLRDRWRLDQLLGTGGMAAVYAATHRNGNRFAIKILHANWSKSMEALQRFLGEGYAANHVGHPGVVSVLDDEVAEDGTPFLVMELLEGETLDVRLDPTGRMDPVELLSMMDELLDILAVAHAKGIVHRDIKPTNIFLTRDGELKLLDFGIARLAHPLRSRLTPLGSTTGTPAYMPPEQAYGRSDELDGRSDLWAVGATMFTALTGEHVHEAETESQELMVAMSKSARSLASVAPELPRPLIDLVDRALAYDKNDRWPDAATMQSAVQNLRAMLIDSREPSARPRDAEVPSGDVGAEDHVAVMSSAQALRRNIESQIRSLAIQRRVQWIGAAAAAVAIAAFAWTGSTRRPVTAEAHSVLVSLPEPAAQSSPPEIFDPMAPAQPESNSWDASGPTLGSPPERESKPTSAGAIGLRAGKGASDGPRVSLPTSLAKVPAARDGTPSTPNGGTSPAKVAQILTASGVDPLERRK